MDITDEDIMIKILQKLVFNYITLKDFLTWSK